MMVRLLAPAELELDDAVAYYDAQLAGLGNAFLLEFGRCVGLIQRHPQGWHPLADGIRRCRLVRFPYAIVYVQDAGGIVVLAVMHLHRRPEYWRDRLNRQKD